MSKMASRFAAVTNKEISQIIKQGVPEIHYSETNPQLLCAFNADGSKTGFSSVHRSAVEPELIFVFLLFLSFSFFFLSGDRKIANMLCNTHLVMQVGK